MNTSKRIFGRFLWLVFIATVMTLGLLRFLFIQHYGSNLPNNEIFASMLRGLQFDAKWTALFLFPALLVYLVSFSPRCAKFISVAKTLTIFGASALFLLGLVNFAFFGFYGTPINSLVFGFLEDDTVAIVVTIWKDWPVFTYTFIWLLFVALITLLCSLTREPISQSWPIKGINILLLLVVFGLCARGSIGKFPLRHTDLNVSTNTFINQSVNNGAQAFYDAIKERQSQDIGRNPLKGLKAFKLASVDEARNHITLNPLVTMDTNDRPHIVLTIMEAMGRDLFESHRADNNMLGAFEEAMKSGDLFLNAMSSENGTFPSVEGLLFNTPISPISQSKYGSKSFEFSQILPFKKAGYRTIFLTSGTAAWRNISGNFPKHGYDEIYDDVTLKNRYGVKEANTWGIPDEYMFRYASELLVDATKNGERLFIVMLSTTNHSPHQTPKNYDLKPLSLDALPSWMSHKNLELSMAIMETFQYANDALGQFLLSMPQTVKDQTIVVATGDHNSRSIFEYPDSSLLDHQFSVPVYFQVPETWRPSSPDTTKWVGHFDIFPTLKELALHQPALPSEGCNLYSNARCEAITFSEIFGGKGVAINELGAVANFNNPQYFIWVNNRLQPTNNPPKALQDLEMRAKAKIGLADYTVRNALIY